MSKLIQSNIQSSKISTNAQSINYIIHISDIHIPLFKRHKEYKSVFENLYQKISQIKTNLNIATTNINIPLVIIITGDLLHSKSELSPECVSLTYNFLKTLASLAPTFLIPGNHDINMNNKERLDSITPIIGDLAQHYPIYYILKSQIVYYSNLAIYHSSIFDYHILNPDFLLEQSSISTSTTFKKIILFHGKINGVELFNGVKLDNMGETDTITNKTITPSSFNGYDMVLLGDIHHHQFIKPHIAYAGSLIQQNHGETREKHGIILWDVNKCTGEHIEITNDYGFITLNINAGIPSYLCVNPDGDHKNDCNLPPNIRLRICHDGIGNESFISDYVKTIKCNHTVHELATINNATLNDIKFKSATTITSSTSDDIFRIIDPKIQFSYIKEYLNTISSINNDEIVQLVEISNFYNRQLEHSYMNINIGVFQLVNLEFSNMFCYGTNNTIDFTKLNGVVGIIAENHMGKSSLLDIILYALFDEVSRKGGTAKDIINQNKDNFILKLQVRFNDWLYTIIKSGTRLKKDSNIKLKINFSRINEKTGIIENLEQDTASKTKTFIASTFGNFDDIINTCFSIQDNSNSFINSENTKRKKELERILKLEFLEELISLVNRDILIKKGGIDTLSSLLNVNLVQKHVQRKLELDKTIEKTNIDELQLDKVIEQYKQEIIQLQHKHEISDYNIIIKEINKIINELDLDYDINLDDTCIPLLKEEKTNIIKQLENLEKPSLNENITDIIFNLGSSSYTTSDLIKKDDTKLINSLIKAKKEELDINIGKWKDKLKKLDKSLEEKMRERKSINFPELKDITSIENFKLELVKNLEVQEEKLKLANEIINNNSILKKKLYELKNSLIEKHSNLSNIPAIIVSNDSNLHYKKLQVLKQKVEKYEKLKGFIMEKNESLNKLLGSNESEYEKSRDKWFSYLINLEGVDDVKAYLTSKKYKHLKTFTNFMENTRIVNNKDFITNELIPEIENLDKNDNLENKCNIEDSVIVNQEEDDEDNENEDNDEDEDEIEDKNASNQKLRDNLICEIDGIKKEIADVEFEMKKLFENSNSISVFGIIKDENELKQLHRNLNTEVSKLKENIKLLDTEYISRNSNKLVEQEINQIKETKLKYETKIEIASSDKQLDYLHQISTFIIETRNYINENKNLLNKQDLIDKIIGLWINNMQNIKHEVHYQNSITELNNNVETAKKQLGVVKTEIVKLRTERAQLNTIIAEFKKNNAELQKLAQEKKLLEHYKDALKHIPYTLFQKVAPILEGRINELLSIMTDFTIKVEIGESSIDMFLTRTMMGDRKILINNISGFEKFISSLAIRLALLSINNLPRINFIAIDEGWSCFDSHNIQNVNVIMDYLVRKFDFVITMSHMPSIKECCDLQIMLKKNEEGYSNVVY
jgi:DNA repair exonuclease SbcCD ATPase subunit/predicted MPP superfamily phosphohydrolase